MLRSIDSEHFFLVLVILAWLDNVADVVFDVTADEVFDLDDIDFDREDLYLDGVPELETIEYVANAESSTAAPRASSPTPSEAMTTSFGRNFRLQSPVRRQFIVEPSSAPARIGRQVLADSSSFSLASDESKSVLPVGRVLNAGKRKRQLAYYYLKKYGQPRAKMMPKPENTDVSCNWCIMASMGSLIMAQGRIDKIV